MNVLDFIESPEVVLYAIGLLGAGASAAYVLMRRSIVKENRLNLASAFGDLVRGLSSGDLETKMASAILLRRFLDQKSEFGVGGAPFAEETVNVISAILKTLGVSEFQKTLADGLRFAPSKCLEKGDFQRVNLSNGYFGGDSGKVSFRGGDFYQANLSGASFKNATLTGAQFYEAKLAGTVFEGAVMSKCNFSSAICRGTNFRNSDLRGANFSNAVLRNVDFSGAKLDGAQFNGASGYGISGADSKQLAGYVEEVGAKNSKKVFLSRPGALDVRQIEMIERVRELVKSHGLEPIDLPREEYDKTRVLSNLSGRMNDCASVIIFGFKSLYVRAATYRPDTEDAKTVRNVYLPTPWSHIEAGMAFMKKIPVLVLAEEGILDGFFDEGIDDPMIARCPLDRCFDPGFENVSAWISRVTATKTIYSSA